MREPVRALYGILVCIALLVLDVRASDDLEMISIDSNNREPMSSTQNRNTSSLIEHLDDSLDNSVSFVSEYQLVSTRTEEIEYYSCSSSNSTEIYDHDADQPMECTKQPGPLSHLYSTICNSGTKYLPASCISNEPAQECAEPIELSNYEQPRETKRVRQTIKENISSKKTTVESTASSLNENCAGNSVLSMSKINPIGGNISVWNNSRLKNRHREGQNSGYKPAIKWYHTIYRKYIETENENSPKKEAHIKHYSSVYNAMPINNEFWFAIASQRTSMHTKLADCKAMNANPSDYRFIKELSGYYPGLPGDIVRYMDKHGPIVSNQESIKTEWTETLGDIYVREPIKPEYILNRESVICKDTNKYNPLDTAVRMILGLSEVYKDLSNLTVDFIENTLKDKRDLNHLAVVKKLHKIVKKHKKSNKSNIDKQYAALCTIFKYILHQTNISNEFIVIQLYTEMYKSITYFYEKAEICEEILDIEKKRRKSEKGKEYHLLTGKCIAKPQRYIKCTTTIDLNKPVCENTHIMEEETNKWTISADVQKHYHIHYVDNTKQKYTRVCMPMYSDPIHTISQTIEYLKKIYSIEKEEYICPYKRNSSGDWECIQEEEKNKTVNEFVDCYIVFYYIEEGLIDNYFTFAEFESYIQPQDETVRIPLFLSPLMRSAVSMGPFVEEDKIKHTVISNMQSMCLQPSVYMYKKKYKAMKYSHVHHYYSNLYIRRDNADVPTIDCYIMDSKTVINNKTVTVEWYVKIPNSIDEYTHCILSDELVNDQGKYDKFIEAVKSQEYTPDSALYGFGLQSSLEKTSGLDCVDCSTNDPIGQKELANYKLSIIYMHKMPVEPKMTDIELQPEVDSLKREINRINIKIKDPGTTKKQKNELKKKRQSLHMKKYCNIKNIKKKWLQDHPLIKEKPDTIPFPPCTSFIVFRHSNTQANSNLGAHNEILDALTRRYNTLVINS